MKPERIDAEWMEEHQLISIDELQDRWGVSASLVQEFIAHGVLEAADATAGAFRLEAVALVRTACRLQQELELDPHAVGVVLELLQRVRTLEDELNALRARLADSPPAGGEPPEAPVISARRP